MIRDKHKRDHVVIAADIYFVIVIFADYYESQRWNSTVESSGGP